MQIGAVDAQMVGNLLNRDRVAVMVFDIFQCILRMAGGMQGIKIKEYLERTSLPDDLVVHFGHDDQLRLCHEKMYCA